jgi:uncharacterized protein YbbC (DUF1343 family)
VKIHAFPGKNMTSTGLDIISNRFPEELFGKRIGLLCHAASITSCYEHCSDVFLRSPCTLSALFGPQHGMHGQTQDNMVEWEGTVHPALKIPVYSLYGKSRKPSPESLSRIDALVIDLQDVGARPYTYIWTVKLCLDACEKARLPVWVLDRPNPVAAMPFDGPMLSKRYFSFVGGAEIPLCHRLTIAEMALLLKKQFSPSVDLHIVTMEGWWRNSLWHETGLPWVLPSPNMPCVETAAVYPGMVLLEATNMSEGRGTTRPFEIIGAPYFKTGDVLNEVKRFDLQGCVFREHDFVPTFQKWQGVYCRGIQVHVTEPRKYKPVFTTGALLHAVIRTSEGEFAFKNPPYEYDSTHMPFDILSGDEMLRAILASGGDLVSLEETWKDARRGFFALSKEIAQYPEEKQ